MESQLLKYLALVKTVETGSFTRAAQALNYAQSSVSKMVADLEAEWGMTLLERSKRGVCLTSAGEQVLPFLRKVLNDHAELEGQICRMNGIEALNGLPFLLLEHGGKTEVSDLLERAHVQPDVRFTTWEDFAIMAMAERGLGVGILPDLILRRIPYRIEIRPLANPYYRPIGLAVNPPLPPDARSQEVHRIPAVPGSGRMTPRCRICSHTFFLFLLEIKHIFFRRTG